MGRITRESETKGFKRRDKSSKKRLGEMTSRDKKLGVERPREKTKGKSQDKSRRGKSRKSVVECSE